MRPRLAGGHNDTVVAGFDRFAGCAAARYDLGLVDDDPMRILGCGESRLPCGVRHRPWLHRADQVVDGLGRPRPVDQSVFLAELRRFGDLCLVLGQDGNGPRSQCGNCPGDEGSTQARESPLELAGRFIRADRGARGGEDAAGIDAGRHSDDGDTGFGLAILDRPRDRGRAAIRGQNRTVQVDSAQPRDRQQPGGEDLAISRRHQEVRRECSDALEAFRRIDVFGLFKRDTAATAPTA